MTGRWLKVRELGAFGWGRPYMIDRKWGRVVPHSESGEWWKSKDGIWVPTIRGGAGYSYRGVPRPLLWYADVSSFNNFSQNTLSNNYTAGSAGTAIAARHYNGPADTLQDIYCYIPGAVTGTPTFLWEVRTNNVNKPDTSGAAVASGTFSPTGTSWNKIAGVNVSLSANTVYWIIIAAQSADGSNKADIQRSVFGDNSGTSIYSQWANGFTSNGWIGASVFNAWASICATFTSGKVMGCPYVTQTGASSTNRRGIRIGSIDPHIGIAAMVGASGALTGTDLAEIWLDANGPGGSPDYASDLQMLTDVSSIAGYMFGTPRTIPVGSTARAVFRYSGGGTTPIKMNIGTGADANLRKMMFGEGAWYWAQANGTSDWSNDDTNGFPQMHLLTEDVSGGVGTPLTVNVQDRPR